MADVAVGSASPFESAFGFCRARRLGDRIVVAGTAPIGPDGAAACVGDVAGQARRCFAIIEQAIAELGGALADVARTRMFLTRIEDWQIVGGVHGEVFGGGGRDGADANATPPVATMVAVAA